MSCVMVVMGLSCYDSSILSTRANLTKNNYIVENKINIQISQFRTVKGIEVPTTWSFQIEDNREGLTEEQFIKSVANRITKKLFKVDSNFRSQLTEFNKSQMEKQRLLRNGLVSICIDGYWVTNGLAVTTDTSSVIKWDNKKVNVFKQCLTALLLQVGVIMSDDEETILPTEEDEVQAWEEKKAKRKPRHKKNKTNTTQNVVLQLN